MRIEPYDMSTHPKEQTTTLYKQFQNCSDLDLRDNRGKRHNLAFILLGLLLGLLRKRDGSLSSLHRNMVNNNEAICVFLGIDTQPVVSRPQLPLVLQKVNLRVFEQLLFDTYKIELSDQEKQWFAGDGKELRGSIEKGDKRGEALVQLVRHQDRSVLGEGYYNGRKESEKPCLQDLIAQTGASNQKITMDALHLCPAMTEPIAQAGGTFLIGLKENQAALLAEMNADASFLKPVNEGFTIDKGHGRLDERAYFHYDVCWESFDPRWAKSNFQSLFKVKRKRLVFNTGKQSEEVSYYLSNGRIDQKEDFFGAIRRHWAVETSNHVRDVSLKEDHLRTKKKPITKALAALRTLVLKLLELIKPKNMVAQLELFQDKFQLLLKWLRKIEFL